MAKDELVGNMPTEKLITYFKDELELYKDKIDIQTRGAKAVEKVAC